MIENRPEVYRQYIHPFVGKKDRQKVDISGKTYQVSRYVAECGYDVTLGYPITLRAGYAVLAVTHERVEMPYHLAADVLGKSTWARLGISLNTTKVDPGFCGWVTLEITYNPLWSGLWSHWKGILYPKTLHLPRGVGIGTLVFMTLAQSVSYDGKYQNSGEYAEEAR